MSAMRKPTITTESGRYFLTDRIRDEVNFYGTPQSEGIAPPPVQKPAAPGSRIIPLPAPAAWAITPYDPRIAIAERESHRHFTGERLLLDALTFLLWATQGVRNVLHETAVPRTVPSVTFIWTAVMARTEWRYTEASDKVIALDAGHVCQNLYLACEVIGAGTCAIADDLVGVDGNEELTVYIASVGKVARKSS